MTAPSAPLRADARRNRERLVSVAAEAFAAHEPIPLDAIARRAGVGSGTLYRHFPTREDLVEEVYRDQVRPLREEAERLLAGEGPARALTEWMHTFARWIEERCGACEALVAMSATGRFGTGPVCDEVQQILSLFLEAGVRAGEMRGEIDPADVGGIMVGTLSVTEGPLQSDQRDRMLQIVVRGLRTSN